MRGKKGNTVLEYTMLAIAVTTSLLIMSKWARKFLLGKARESIRTAWGEIEDTGTITRTVKDKPIIVR